MKRLRHALALATVAAGLLWGGHHARRALAWFPDPRLEAAVREACQREGLPFAPAGFARLGTLELELSGDTLAGLERLTALRGLEVRSQGGVENAPGWTGYAFRVSRLIGFDDLSRYLWELDQLRPRVRSTVDFSPLAARCPGLRRLRVDFLSIHSYGALAGLPELADLEVNNCTLDEPAAFARFVRLERLALRDSLKAADEPAALAALGRLPALRTLHLGGLAADPGPALAPLATLETLIVTNAPLRDAAFIDRLPRLRELRIYGTIPRGGCQITTADLARIARLARLERLTLSRLEFADLTPLASHPSLRVLNLCSNNIIDPSPLLSLASLRKVSLQDNPLGKDARESVIPALKAGGVEVEY